MTGANGQVKVMFHGIPLRAGSIDMIDVYNGVDAGTMDPITCRMGQTILVSRSGADFLLREYGAAFERAEVPEKALGQPAEERDAWLFGSGIGNFVMATPAIQATANPVIYVQPSDPRGDHIASLSPWPVIKSASVPFAKYRRVYVVGGYDHRAVPEEKLGGFLDGRFDWSQSTYEPDYYRAWIPDAPKFPAVVKTEPAWTMHRGRNERIIALANGSAAAWSRNPPMEWAKNKRWPDANMAELVRRLGPRGFTFAVVGVQAEAKAGEELKEAAPGRVWNFAGRLTAAQSADLIRQSDLLLCSDTGMMHVGAAVGARVLAIWGATLLSKNRPMTDRAGIIASEGGGCDAFPCFGKPEQSTCRDARCMAAITVDRVEAGVLAAFGMDR